MKKLILILCLVAGVSEATETYNRYDVSSNKLLLSAFTSGEWTKTSVSGTVNDSTTFTEIVCVSGDSCVIEKVQNFDLSLYSAISDSMYISDVAKVDVGNTYCRLSNSNYSKYYSFALPITVTGRNYSVYPLYFASKVNTPNKSNIDRIRIKLKATTGNTITVKLYKTEAIKNPLTKPVILNTFDDGVPSQYDSMAPIADSCGIKTTIFVIGKNVGTITGLTIPQILNLQSRGHTIGSHTWNHQQLGVLADTTAVQTEMELLYTFQKQYRIFGKEVMAYPFGSYTGMVMDALKSKYTFARTVTTGINSAIDVPFGYRTYSVDSTLTVASFKAYIDSVHQRSEPFVYTIMWHDITPTGTSLAYSPSKFSQIMHYMKQKVDSNLIDVKSLEQYYGRNLTVTSISDDTIALGQPIIANGLGFSYTGITSNNGVLISQNNDYSKIKTNTGGSSITLTNVDGSQSTKNITILGTKYTTPASSYDVWVNRFFADDTILHIPIWQDISQMPKAVFDTTSQKVFRGSDSLSKFVESVSGQNGSCFVDGSVSNIRSVKYNYQYGNFSVSNSVNTFKNSGCVFRLGFEETTGNPIDATGNNTIAVNGTNITRNLVGAYGNSKAWKFGANTYLTSDITALNGVTKFTFECFFYPDTIQTASSGARIFSTGYSAGNYAYMNITPTALGGEIVKSVTGTFSLPASTIRYLSPKAYHHIVLSFNGERATNADKLKLYIDGEDVSSLLTITGTLPTQMPTRSDYRISNVTNYDINGRLDEVNFYTDAKTLKFAKFRYNNFINESSIITYQSVSTTTGSSRWDAYKSAFKSAYKRAWK